MSHYEKLPARQNVSSDTRFEDEVGYSRAVRLGRHVYVSGTTASEVESDDPYLQTKLALEGIEQALKCCSARMEDVVRTRMYVVDIAHWESIARAHHERFGAIRPAAAMVQVARLIDPRLLVEIETDAYLDSDSRT